MKRFGIVFFGILLMVIAGVWVGRMLQKQSTVTIRNARIQVDIADTAAKRTQGLSGRTSLPTNHGMLFIFPREEIHTFWMKGMQFPLDFIWIRSDTVVDLTTHVPPPSPETQLLDLPRYSPQTPCDKVLEVPAGTVASLGIEKGDTVTYE